MKKRPDIDQLKKINDQRKKIVQVSKTPLKEKELETTHRRLKLKEIINKQN